MPGNLHFFDTTLPRAADANGKSTAEQLAGIYNYLYMLLEQLRYTLANLDGSNINAAALSGFQKLITEPINVRLEDAEGNIHTLELTAGALDSRITQEAQRADGAEQQLSSRITQTAESIVSEVMRATAAEGALSSRITQTATEVQSKISGTEAQSLIDQTLGEITLSVTSGVGGSSISLTSNGTTISSRTVDLYVDSANIYGTLTADEIRGSTFKLLDDDDDTAATFYLTGASSIDDQKMVIETGALELDSNGGDVFIAANTYRGALVSAIQIKGGYDEVACVGDFVPNSSGAYNLGRSDLYWNNIYCYNSAVDLSDREEKTDIDYVLAMDAFFDGLRPASFKMLHGSSGRTHYGMIAQDVEELLISLGMSGTDFAGFVKSTKDGETHYGLRYGEFIPLCIDQIKKLKARVNELERAS